MFVPSVLVDPSHQSRLHSGELAEKRQELHRLLHGKTVYLDSTPMDSLD